MKNQGICLSISIKVIMVQPYRLILTCFQFGIQSQVAQDDVLNSIARNIYNRHSKVPTRLVQPGNIQSFKLLLIVQGIYHHRHPFSGQQQLFSTITGDICPNGILNHTRSEFLPEVTLSGILEFASALIEK